MKIKILDRDADTLKKHLDGKRRIMIYGAGSWAGDIKKMVAKYGYNIDCFIVDAQYYYGDNDEIRTMETLDPPYNAKEDVMIWAIGSPEKLHGCLEENVGVADCFLIWDMGFWKDKNYAAKHKKEFDEAQKLLCDEYSKQVYKAYIEAQEGHIDNDIQYCTSGTYFNELTKKKIRGGAFVDCGSYDGESAINYIKFAGEECRVYAFEPDRDNFEKLVERVRNNPEFICLNKGCYSSEKKLSFNSNGDMSSSLAVDGDETVEVTTIDKVVGNEKVAFIKMDVEGAELEALKGARQTIERDMPVLAISVYHKQEDLITILPYISKLHNGNITYNLYLRHHGVVATELVLYGIPTI